MINYKRTIRKPYTPKKVPLAFGVIVGMILVVFGIVFAIPNMGLYGMLWTLMSAAITLYNLFNLIKEIKARNNTKEKNPTDAIPPEERLMTLNQLHAKGLLTQAEYDEKRKEILRKML